MTRCDECHLISRTDEGRLVADGQSYQLDADSRAAVRAMLTTGRERVRLLQVVRGALPAVRVADDARIQSTIVDSLDLDALSALPPGSFDAAFVNGAVEYTDPVTLMHRVRAAVRAGGDIVVIVGAALSTAVGTQLPRYAYTAAPLTRLALTTGCRPRSCGILSRSIDTPLLDPRLSPEQVPFERLARLIGSVAGHAELPSGLLAMHARAEAPPARPKLSIVIPVFNEVHTFAETFELVYGTEVAGVDREIVIVESNSTDGSRDLVRKIESRPGVITIYEDHPSGKGHAVRAGIAASTGDFVLIQDADSEYDVGDYDIVLHPLLQLSSTFVLGSRHLGGRTWKIRNFGDAYLLAYVMNLAHEGFHGARELALSHGDA